VKAGKDHGVLKLKQLHSDGRVTDVPLKVPLLKAQNVFDEAKAVKAGDYGIPRSRIYQAVDSLTPDDLAWQMSVSNEHDYGVDGLKAVKDGLKPGKKPLRVVLVCPLEVVEHVRWQTLKRGKQVVKAPRGLEEGTGLLQFVLGVDY